MHFCVELQTREAHHRRIPCHSERWLRRRLVLYLLGDVPDASVVVYKYESVWSGHVMERSSLLVAEEHVRDPDLLPAVVAQLQLGAVVVTLGVERQPTVIPLLTQVHAQREILRTRCNCIHQGATLCASGADTCSARNPRNIIIAFTRGRHSLSFHCWRRYMLSEKSYAHVVIAFTRGWHSVCLAEVHAQSEILETL